MLSTTKAVINNLNQFKFIKNINKVDLVKDSSKETNNPIAEEASKDKILELQEENRISNLKVFTSSYARLRAFRFFAITLPACLSAAAIYLFTTPTRVDKEDNAKHYVREETVFSTEAGVFTSQSDVYDLGEAGEMFGHKLANPEMGEVNNYIYDSILVKIHNGEQCVTGVVKISDTGNMSVSEADSVSNYFDTDGYKGYEFKTLEDDSSYIELFNRVVLLLNDSGYLSKGEKELLDSLVDDEKREIILDIINYQNVGSEEILVSKTRMPRRIILAIVAAIYDIIVIGMFVSGYGEDADILINDDGKLNVDNDNSDPNIFFGAIKMREAFKAAERDRILNLEKEINENVGVDDRAKLLTSYEKKLIKKNGKNKNI